jgi:hypothetical protein
LEKPVLLDIALAAVLALAGVSGFVLWIRRAAANTRTIDAPAGEPDGLFRGGVMARHVLTSGSLARLELFDWGVRLSGTVISRWIVPTWEARYDQLAIAELATLPASRIAVWLRVRGEPHAIGFLTADSQEILTLLQERGVPVNRVITQVRRVEELYR